MILVEVFQYSIVHRFDGRRDKQASAALQFWQQHGMFDEVLHFDRGIEAEVRKFPVQRSRELQCMSRTIEKIGIAKGDVFGAHCHLAADVGKHHGHLHDAEFSLVHGHHRTVAAPMLATPAALGKAHDLGAPVRHLQMGVAGKRRKPGSIRREKLDPAETDDRLALDLCAAIASQALGEA